MQKIKNKLKKNALIKDLLEKMTFRFRFSKEIRLINNSVLKTNDQPSVIHYSLNKSATQYVSEVLKTMGKSNGLVPVNLNGYAFRSNFPYLDHLPEKELEKYQYLFRPKGILYSVFGGSVHGIKSLDKYRVVVMIRDPRDILVSGYFSLIYSHGLPISTSTKSKNFANKRQVAKEMSIDEFVLSESLLLKKRLDNYIELNENSKENILITKYEFMISDFSGWLDQLSNFCNFEVSEKTKRKLQKKHQKVKPKSENINSHTRKGIWGDFKNKLEPKTLDLLNEEFGDVLSYFNYDSQ